LTRVSGKTHWRAIFRVALLEKLAELLELAVGQGIHRIDDDGLNDSPRPMPQDMIHNRHDVGQALAGARTAGEYVRPPLLRLEDGLALMLMQYQRLTGRVGVRLVDPEDARAFSMQHALGDEI